MMWRESKLMAGKHRRLSVKVNSVLKLKISNNSNSRRFIISLIALLFF